MQSETEALIEHDPEAPPTTAAQAPPRPCHLLADRLDPAHQSSSRGSVCSPRRASSLEHLDGVRGEWAGPYGEPRPSSSECLTQQGGGGVGGG